VIISRNQSEGLATFSPRLDMLGNSLRGVAFCRKFSEQIVGVHAFGNLPGLRAKAGPYWNKSIWHSSLRDTSAARALFDLADKDGNGVLDQTEAFMLMELLTAQSGNARRFGGGEAQDPEEHAQIILEMLEDLNPYHVETITWEDFVSWSNSEKDIEVYEVLVAAKHGDTGRIKQLAARGCNLAAGDYDARTALHLAAGEGHEDTVMYLLKIIMTRALSVGENQCATAEHAPHSSESFTSIVEKDLNSPDRVGNTPLDDARRAGHEGVVLMLEAAINTLSLPSKGEISYSSPQGKSRRLQGDRRRSGGSEIDKMRSRSRTLAGKCDQLAKWKRIGLTVSEVRKFGQQAIKMESSLVSHTDTASNDLVNQAAVNEFEVRVNNGQEQEKVKESTEDISGAPLKLAGGGGDKSTTRTRRQFDGVGRLFVSQFYGIQDSQPMERTELLKTLASYGIDSNFELKGQPLCSGVQHWFTRRLLEVLEPTCTPAEILQNLKKADSAYLSTVGRSRSWQTSKVLLPTLGRVLRGRLVVPNFPMFKSHLKRIIEVVTECKTQEHDGSALYGQKNSGRSNSAYIVSVCTADGQCTEMHACSNSNVEVQRKFRLNSLVRPIVYGLVKEQLDLEHIEAGDSQSPLVSPSRLSSQASNACITGSGVQTPASAMRNTPARPLRPAPSNRSTIHEQRVQKSPNSSFDGGKRINSGNPLIDGISAWVGHEPNGGMSEFEEVNAQGKPYNPLIDSGALTTFTLLFPHPQHSYQHSPSANGTSDSQLANNTHDINQGINSSATTDTSSQKIALEAPGSSADVKTAFATGLQQPGRSSFAMDNDMVEYEFKRVLRTVRLMSGIPSHECDAEGSKDEHIDMANCVQLTQSMRNQFVRLSALGNILLSHGSFPHGLDDPRRDHYGNQKQFKNGPRTNIPHDRLASLNTNGEIDMQQVRLSQTLTLIQMIESIKASPKELSIIAGCLAFGGVCPLTKHRVFQAETVKQILSLMITCGMGVDSGEFSFRVGIPATRCGRGSVIMLVVPNVLGLCFASAHGEGAVPPLQPSSSGLSKIAMEFCTQFASTFNFHIYDEGHAQSSSNTTTQNVPIKKHGDENGSTVASTFNPLFYDGNDTARRTSELLAAAGSGDLAEIKSLAALGFDLNSADYDDRTAAHLAASEGQTEALRYFALEGVELFSKDRWGNTPVDDALRENHPNVLQFFDRIRRDSLFNTPTQADSNILNISAASMTPSASSEPNSQR